MEDIAAAVVRVRKGEGPHEVAPTSGRGGPDAALASPDRAFSAEPPGVTARVPKPVNVVVPVSRMLKASPSPQPFGRRQMSRRSAGTFRVLSSPPGRVGHAAGAQNETCSSQACAAPLRATHEAGVAFLEGLGRVGSRLGESPPGRDRCGRTSTW